MQIISTIFQGEVITAGFGKISTIPADQSRLSKPISAVSLLRQVDRSFINGRPASWGGE
jgi:hypothetical protein